MNPPRIYSDSESNGAGAFSLVELLVVIASIGILTALIVPATRGLKGTQDLTSAAYAIQGALDQARTYAVANNTYTWVGFFEEDNTKPSQTPAQAGVGRVVICTVASRDGSCIYNKTQAQADAPSVQDLPGSRLVQIGKLVKVSGVHIFDATSQAVGKRQAGIIESAYLVGLTSQALLFSFQYPLTNSTHSYTFGVRPVSSANGVIQFSPQGEALSDAGPMTLPATTFEIAIKEAHGSQAGNAANVTALDLNGLTGQTTIYRP
jgi:type II secretory pathway pseudopilin PulG